MLLFHRRSVCLTSYVQMLSGQLIQLLPLRGPWPVRNRAARQEVSGRRASEAPSAAPHRSHYCLDHPPYSRPWKNCLPRNWSLVPKRLGTTALAPKFLWNPFGQAQARIPQPSFPLLLCQWLPIRFWQQDKLKENLEARLEEKGLVFPSLLAVPFSTAHIATEYPSRTSSPL